MRRPGRLRRGTIGAVVAFVLAVGIAAVILLFPFDGMAPLVVTTGGGAAFIVGIPVCITGVALAADGLPPCRLVRVGAAVLMGLLSTLGIVSFFGLWFVPATVASVVSAAMTRD